MPKAKKTEDSVAIVAVDPISGSNIAKLKKRQHERVNTQNAPTYYANSVEVATSMWDFRLRFGEVLEGTEDRLVVKDVATLFLAPSQAKAVSIILSRKVKEYEEKLGIELPVPAL